MGYALCSNPTSPRSETRFHQPGMEPEHAIQRSGASWDLRNYCVRGKYSIAHRTIFHKKAKIG
jgi:hypothetical protein